MPSCCQQQPARADLTEPAAQGPADGALLAELSRRSGAAPFQKHLWHMEEQRWALAEETWAACDQACAERGIDLRYFHIGRELHGALRFNEKATIGAVRTRHPWPFSSALTAASPHRSSSPTSFRFSTC